MEIEDCTQRTQAALQNLEKFKTILGLQDLEVLSMAEFQQLARRETLRVRERRTLVEESILMIEQMYSHLPFKQARYAINPVRRLRLLLNQVGQYSDPKFHREMLDIFLELRDAHTYYALPVPYKDRAAFLPFLLASYSDSGVPKFIVSEIMAGFDHPSFVRDVEVTHWNGVPIVTAVQRMADQSPAGNASSRFSRGLARLTLRMLTFSALPDEEMVFVQYRPLQPSEPERVVAIPWNVAKGFSMRAFTTKAVSVCGVLAQSAHLRQILWRPQYLADQKSLEDACRKWEPKFEQKKAKTREKGPAGVDLRKVSTMPRVFEFQYHGGDDKASPPKSFLACPEAKGRRLGYLRIKRFDSPTEDAFFSDRFVGECQRILELLSSESPDGLILDLRGNPGGEIEPAERILQLFTPVRITPARFHLVNSPFMQAIAIRLGKGFQEESEQAFSELEPWLDDLRNSITEGDLVTNGHAITSEQLANNTGQAYHGRVVALSDARVYSAAEIFLAGFQDHMIGNIIGVSETTGGGGASRWQHKEITGFTMPFRGLRPGPVRSPSGLRFLPKGADLGFAIRRSSRVGPNAGITIEDVGVRSNIDYRVTREDLCYGDKDLIAFACGELVAARSCRLQIVQADLAGGHVTVTVRCANLARLECYLDDHPQASTALAGGKEALHTLKVPTAGLSRKPARLTVRGYCRGRSGVEFTLAASSSTDIHRVRAKRPPVKQ